jgi:hypothetical protein
MVICLRCIGKAPELRVGTMATAIFLHPHAPGAFDTADNTQRVAQCKGIPYSGPLRSSPCSLRNSGLSPDSFLTLVRRACHGYGNTRGDRVTGTTGTGTVVDFGTPCTRTAVSRVCTGKLQ